MNYPVARYKKVLWLVFFGYFFILMLTITFKYFPIDAGVAFLSIKQTEVTQITGYLPVFYIHVGTSILALLAGFTQFNSSILSNKTYLHRTIGIIYVTTILLFAAPSGFFIGCFANGGSYSKLSFTILAVLWFWFTLKSFIAIKNKNITEHQKFMYRSFALTLSAITLRLWKVILVYLFQPSPMDVYQIIAWFGWVPNFVFAEFYLHNKFKS